MSDSPRRFRAFWRATHGSLQRALAATLADGQLAAEAVDEAMVRAYSRWGRVGSLDDPAGWVFRVAFNWATSWLRKRRRRPIRPAEQLDRPKVDSRADVGLQRAVLGLDQHHRAVVVLRLYLDWPVARVAEALGIAEGTVKSRLHRALDELRGHLEVSA